jgi:hypothetical protein
MPAAIELDPTLRYTGNDRSPSLYRTGAFVLRAGFACILGNSQNSN